jgi:hypothetical protein
VKGKTLGIILIIAALALIATGIMMKRMFAMGQYLIIFHGLGGLLLVTGAGMLFLKKEE